MSDATVCGTVRFSQGALGLEQMNEVQSSFGFNNGGGHLLLCYLLAKTKIHHSASCFSICCTPQMGDTTSESQSVTVMHWSQNHAKHNHLDPLSRSALVVSTWALYLTKFGVRKAALKVSKYRRRSQYLLKHTTVLQHEHCLRSKEPLTQCSCCRAVERFNKFRDRRRYLDTFKAGLTYITENLDPG